MHCWILSLFCVHLTGRLGALVLVGGIAVWGKPEPLRTSAFSKVYKSGRWGGMTLSSRKDLQLETIVRKRLRSTRRFQTKYGDKFVDSSCQVVSIGVVSTMYNVNERNAIRSSWKYDALKFPCVNIVFVVGVINNSTYGMYNTTGNLDHDRLRFSKLLDEAAAFKDILFVPVLEQYNNVLLKTLHYLDYCSTFKHLRFCIKADHDVYINVERLVDKLNVPGATKRYQYHGHLWGGRPIRDSQHKNFVSKESYPWNSFRPYVQGAMIVLSAEVVGRVVENHDLLSKNMIRDEGNLEDVQISLWMYDFLKSKPTHEASYVTAETCHQQGISLYDIPVELMVQLGGGQDFCSKPMRRMVIENLQRRVRQLESTLGNSSDKKLAIKLLSNAFNNLAVHYILLDEKDNFAQNRMLASGLLQSALRLVDDDGMESERNSVLANMGLINWYGACGDDVECSERLQSKFEDAIRMQSRRLSTPIEVP